MTKEQRLERVRKSLPAEEVAPQHEDHNHQAHLARCREDVNTFCEHVFQDSQSRAPFQQATIHRQWHAHIDAHHRALILAPREHGKTDQIAVGRVLFELGRNPQLRVKIVSEDDSTAKKRLTAVKGHIDRNARLHEVFPGLRRHPALDDWTKHTATVDRQGEDKDPSIEAAGILSSAVGGRADLLIFDDVVDFRNAIAQPGQREMVKDAFRNVWINLLSKEGRAVYVATPWHEDDLTHDLEKNPEWALLKQPIGEDLIPLWPEMWSRERLAQRRRDIGSRAFARGFHLVALSDEDALFRNIANCIRPDLNRAHIRPHWRRFTGVDLGHSKRKAGLSGAERPYSVVFTIALDEQNRRWPVEIRRGHWTGPQTATQILEVHEAHRPESILIENNAYQSTILDWIGLISGDATIPLKPFTTGANKADEQIGLPGLAAEFDNGAWIIPTDGVGVEDEDEQAGALWAWIGEMKGYPAAALSDTVMACWFAREATREKFIPNRLFDPQRLAELRAKSMEAYRESAS